MSRFKNIFFLAVLLLAAWLIGQRLWTIRSDRNGRTSVQDEKAAWATRLEPALATIHAWTPKPEQTCALSAQEACWFAYAATGPDGSVIEAMRRSPSGHFTGGELVVGVREHEGASSVVVMTIASGEALCWTEVGGDAPLRDRAVSGVSRITSTVRIVD